MHDRNGFSLVEVMVALVILTVVLLGLGGASGTFLHTVTTSDRAEAAIQLADDRIETIRSDPNYGALDTLYNGTQTGFSGLPGYSRVTQVVHVVTTTPPLDYRKITVTVSGPGLASPIARTISVAAP